MSDDRATDRDATPDIPRLPALPGVMRGLRRPCIPPSDTSSSAAPAHGPHATSSPNPGDRTTDDTSGRPR